MNKLISTVKIIAVSLVLAAGLLAVPTAAPTASVSAHHCFGHAGSGTTASGNIAECVDAGACLDTEATQCPEQASAGTTINNIIKLIINVLSLIVGVVAVIMIIIGGLKYITSSGDPGNVSSAKNTILYAIIGLVIVALAQVIVRFVLSKATGTPAAPTP